MWQNTFGSRWIQLLLFLSQLTGLKVSLSTNKQTPATVFIHRIHKTMEIKSEILHLAIKWVWALEVPFVLLIIWSEASLEARELQLINGSLVGKVGFGDPTGWTSFFTQPHLPVEDTDRKKKEKTFSIQHYKERWGMNWMSIEKKTL